MTTFYPSILGEQVSAEQCGCKIASVMIYRSSSTHDRTKRLIPIKLDQFDMKAAGNNILIAGNILYKKAVIFYQPNLKDVIEVTKSFDITDVKIKNKFTYQNKTIKSGTVVTAINGKLFYRTTTLPDDQCEREKLLKNLNQTYSSITFNPFQISLVGSESTRRKHTQTIQLTYFPEISNPSLDTGAGYQVLIDRGNIWFDEFVNPDKGTDNQFTLDDGVAYYIGCQQDYVYIPPPGGVQGYFFTGILQTMPFADGTLPITIYPNSDPNAIIYNVS